MFRTWKVTALFVTLVFSGCQPAPSSAEVCNGVPAEFGGCDSPQPLFQARTCETVAVEFGAQLNSRIETILAEPTVVAGKARSTRITYSEYLLESRLDQFIDANDFGPCASAQVLKWATPSFSEKVRREVGTALSDSGVTRDFEYFLKDLAKTLEGLDS